MKSLARILDNKKETRQETIANLETQLRTLDSSQEKERTELKYKIEILQREHDFLDLLNIQVWTFLRHLDEFGIRTSKQNTNK